MEKTRTYLHLTNEGELEFVVSRAINVKELADDEIKVMLKHTKSNLMKQRDQYKQQRDELIEDIQAHRDLLKEFSKFIHRKVEACPGKAEYMDFRDSLKKIGITERD